MLLSLVLSGTLVIDGLKFGFRIFLYSLIPDAIFIGTRVMNGLELKQSGCTKMV